jgi:hypothetical protein
MPIAGSTLKAFGAAKALAGVAKAAAAGSAGEDPRAIVSDAEHAESLEEALAVHARAVARSRTGRLVEKVDEILAANVGEIFVSTVAELV